MRQPYLKHKQARKAQGFTLIELLFAMTAFSIMLVVAVSGFLNAMWIYNQATISRENQQQVRNIVDSMGRNIRTATYANVPFNGAITVGNPWLPPVDSGYSSLCLEGSIDGTVYYYKKNNHLFFRKVQSCRLSDGSRYLNAEDPASPGIPLSSEKDLISGGAAVKLWSPNSVVVGQPNTGFRIWQFDQPISPPATLPVQSIRLELGLRRGSDSPVTARDRQFSNDFSINSTFYLRNQGS